MTIGLITEPESYSRKYLLKRFLNLRDFKKISVTANPFDTVAATLPYSRKCLEKMSADRLKKILDKKSRQLAKQGIQKTLLSRFLYELCKAKCIDTGSFENECGKKLFLQLIPLCLRRISAKLSINLFSADVCISDSKMDKISEYLLRELCFDTKNICLCTKNVSAAAEFCESFCDETGLWIDICDTLCRQFDILIDVDNHQIKIGYDLFIREAAFGFDFCGFEVCQTDIAALLSALNTSKISWIYSYEK